MALPIVKFTYKNHRGEVAERTVAVDGVEWINNPGYGYESGYFVSGICQDKNERRSFALVNIHPEHVHRNGLVLFKFSRE